jgi:hypothetical protein
MAFMTHPTLVKKRASSASGILAVSAPVACVPTGSIALRALVSLSLSLSLSLAT